MPTGNLTAAINEAIRMCWDESIGYTFGGDGNPDSNGYDCSAFVIRSLYRAGFSVPSSRVGTGTMGQSVLVPAGFTELSFNTGMQMQNGDIVVINDGSYGHTYFYVENIYGYSDYPAGSAPNYASNVTATFTTLPYAKVEAYSSLGFGTTGDNANSHGAHCEVWVHRLNPNYINNGHPDSTVKIYRWHSPYNPNIDSEALLILGSLLLFRRK